jgi:hypothetical protein
VAAPPAAKKLAGLFIENIRKYDGGDSSEARAVWPVARTDSPQAGRSGSASGCLPLAVPDFRRGLVVRWFVFWNKEIAVWNSKFRPASELALRPRRRWVARLFLATTLLVALTGAALATLFLMRSGRPRTRRVQLVTDLVPLRQELANQLRMEGSRRGLELVLTSKHYGSLDGLKEVGSPNDIKFALVPGGITAGQYPAVRTVTALSSEPLHVLVRPELAEKGLAALRGKRVNIGPTTTCSHHLAREVLEFAGLTPSSESGAAGYFLETASAEDLDRELGRIQSLEDSERAEAIEKLPDAVVFIAPMPSQLARHLVKGGGYQLMPVPFGEAFCLDRLKPPDSDGVRVDRSALSTSVIPPHTYGATPPVPAEACLTISAPLLLVAQDDTDTETVFRLLQIVHDSPLTSTLRPPPLGEQCYSFPPHAGTLRYLHRHDPLVTTESASTLGRIAGGIGALGSGGIAFYTFLRLRKLRRFEAYYHEISQIERVASDVEHDPQAPLTSDALRIYLQTRLSDLRSRVLEDFADGGFIGEGIVAGIIAAIHDTRTTVSLELSSRKEQEPSAGPTSRAEKG